MTKPSNKNKTKSKDINRRALPVSSSSSNSEGAPDSDSDRGTIRSRSPLNGSKGSLSNPAVVKDEILRDVKLRIVKELRLTVITPSSQATVIEGPKETEGTVERTAIKRPASAASPATQEGVVDLEDPIEEFQTEDSDEDYVDIPPETTDVGPPKVKRPRGRPAVTRRYVGAYKARRKAAEAQERYNLSLAEREFYEDNAQRRRETASYAITLDERGVTGKEAKRAILVRRIEDAAKTARMVSLKSGNLKGTFRKALKILADNIAEDLKALGPLSANEEVRRLERDKTSLREEMTQLRAEVASLKKSLSEGQPLCEEVLPPPLVRGGDEAASRPSRKAKKRRTQGSEPTVASPGWEREPLAASTAGEYSGATCPPIPATGDWMEALAARITRQVGDLMSARFAVVESRLPPEEILRPPFVASRRNGAGPMALPSVKEGRSKLTPPVATKSGKGQNKSQSQPQPQPARPESLARAQVKAGESLDSDNLSFVEVVKRSGRKKGAITAPTAPPPPAKGQPGGVAAKPKAAPSNKKGLPAGAPKTASAANKKAPLRGPRWILRPWKLTTSACGGRSPGASFLRPPGKRGASKADKLAEELVAALGDSGVKVSRPVPTSEVRVAGLDDSVTAAEVAASIAVAGGCAAADIRVNGLRPGTGGLHGAWARVPKAAALKAAKTGRLRVGWTMARVELLEARPMQCHRCLEVGHVRNKCPSEVDRSGLCYRCCQEGHLAGTCQAPPKCPRCEAHGRSSYHRMGGKAFVATPPSKKRDGQAKSTVLGTGRGSGGCARERRREDGDQHRLSCRGRGSCCTLSHGGSKEEAMETGK
ncbi:uncharacterized protein LOC120358737 [Solenopsis invicta]|uniref:uncharacterized protein LOC120358737 n=1 Tax=Solenopsis invicta TaxID=13686 RepID=UPI00193E03BD|nr:uncharacterized protein LOC120358737 [Solenopsis invicta]